MKQGYFWKFFENTKKINRPFWFEMVGFYKNESGIVGHC